MSFQPGIIHGEALHEVLAQAFGGPDAELGAAGRSHAVTDSDNGLQVVVAQRSAYLPFTFLTNL